MTAGSDPTVPTPASPPGRLPQAGGIGLKAAHYDAILDAPASERPAWVEVHPQNYFADGGPAHRWLAAIAAVCPLSFHSVGLSLGSAGGLNAPDLEKIAALCERYQPAQLSDHLSWSGNAHDRYPDLLPLPYTRACLDHLTAQIGRVQDRLKRPMLIENPSRYLSYRQDEMSETDFITALCRQAGCGLLFDINNVEVTATNVGLDMEAYIDAIDPSIVGEIHLAGHSTEPHDSGPLLIDDHGSAVSETSWALYRRFVARAGPRPTLIEWDTDVPAYGVLMDEAGKADAILANGGQPGDHHALVR